MGYQAVRIGDCHLGEVRRAAGIPEGDAGGKGQSTAYVLDSDNSALSRKDALEELGGQLDSSRNLLTLTRQGAGTPPRVNRMGRYIPNAVDLRRNPPSKMREAPWFQHRILNGFPRTNVQIYPMADFAPPTR